MLSWSGAEYKATIGVGTLAIAGMLSELWQNVPAWIALVIALAPLVVFVFVHPGELPTRFAGIAHTSASIWYVVVVTSLLVGLATAAKPLPRGWPVYVVLEGLGAVPCGIVLYRWARGKYPPPMASEDGSPESLHRFGRQSGR